MRSEKEIKEMDLTEFYTNEDIPGVGKMSFPDIEGFRKWVLEGEPRYSVAKVNRGFVAMTVSFLVGIVFGLAICPVVQSILHSIPHYIWL